MIGLSQRFVGLYSFAILPNTIQHTTPGQDMSSLDHKIQCVGDDEAVCTLLPLPRYYISLSFITQLIAEAFRVGARNNPAPPTFYVK